LLKKSLDGELLAIGHMSKADATKQSLQSESQASWQEESALLSAFATNHKLRDTMLSISSMQFVLWFFSLLSRAHFTWF
jgi:hypothetical protein